jgi:hypothetical protein
LSCCKIAYIKVAKVKKGCMFAAAKKRKLNRKVHCIIKVLKGLKKI